VAAPLSEFFLMVLDRLKIWMAQIRANFLLLSVALVCIGLAFAWKFHISPVGEGFNWLYAGLITAGVVCSHISVNLFNEYFDFISGIDFKTRRTPFNGGSGMLVRGLTSGRSVLIAASLFLLFALATGIFFTLTAHRVILLLSLAGGFTIVFYNNLLSRLMLGELFAGLTLGSFVVIGTFIAMTASPGMPVAEVLPWPLLLLSFPPGILTSLLLLLNEFPDMEADREGGRRHLVVRFGRERAARIYAAGIFVVFGVILFLPVAGLFSWWVLIALLPLPLALRASFIALRSGFEPAGFLSAQASNVGTVLGTDFLIALAVLI